MEKVYLILGASSDLGCALIKKIIRDSEEKTTIIAHYNSSCEQVKEIASGYSHITFHMLQADLSDLGQTKRMIEEIRDMCIFPTHIVSFCASAYRFNRLSELDMVRMNKDMTIQVYSFGMVCQAFIPNMAEQKYGKIVAMLSSATIGNPPRNTTEYTTVKYALLGFIKSMAADYGDQGININAISPGMIETKFLKLIGRKIKEFTAEASPRHRNLTVDDVTPTIMLLLSEDSQFMNGTNINLSGNSN